MTTARRRLRAVFTARTDNNGRKEIDFASIARASMNSRNDHQWFIIVCSVVYAIYVSTKSLTLFACAVAGYGRTKVLQKLSL